MAIIEVCSYSSTEYQSQDQQGSSEARSTAGLQTVDDSEVTIAVMGATGSGKTTFVNVASGSNLPVGEGLQSYTSVIQRAQPFMLDGQSVTLIDTPGFDDAFRSESDVLRMIAEFLTTNHESNGTRFAGVIYIHKVYGGPKNGIPYKNFRMFRQLCGDDTLQKVAIVMNMWGDVTFEIGGAHKALLASQEMFKPVVDKGALFLCHDNTTESAHSILRQIIENGHSRLLQIQRELVDEQKDISETGAGAGLDEELMLQIQHRREMQTLRDEIEMKEAIRQVQDEQTRHELEIKLWQIYCAKNIMAAAV